MNTTINTTTPATINDINDNAILVAASEAMKNGISESDFTKCLIASMINDKDTSDLDVLKNIQKIQNVCHSSYQKAAETKKAEEAAKAEAAALEKYQSLQAADRIMAKVTKALIDFCDSEIAKKINHMIYKNASSVKVACFIGQYKSDSKAMAEIEYIYESIKCEKDLVRFAGTFVNVYEELCDIK